MDVCFTNDSTESALDECEIDFDKSAKQRLKDVIMECLHSNVCEIDDDYYVNVNLKDDSTYAYAPRKFALKEREQIREITDDLLKRVSLKRVRRRIVRESCQCEKKR